MLFKWIPDSINAILLEAPLPDDSENTDWTGDHSSHILEKGWKQIETELETRGFRMADSSGFTRIFIRAMH